MNPFKELLRREVFRTVGLYIGTMWIVLQVADVVLPIYEAPNWVFKALITVAIIGLPIAALLAWMFDLSAAGIRLEADAGEVPKQRVTGRKADFAVIAVLLLALSISLFLNFAPRDAIAPPEIEPVAVLVANFDNHTGDDVFDGTLEQVLTIGIEESSFISAYDRTTADRVLEEIRGPSRLDVEGGRLVSTREGIDFVVGGELRADGGGYALSISAIDPDDGRTLVALKERADGKTDVLTAVGKLAARLREEFGDAEADAKREGEETFTTTSLEAMHDYVRAQSLARDGRDDEAIDLYQSAVEKDPRFGRAWSGLAVSAHKLGRSEVAEDAWKNALSLLDTMTERERYRTAGAYYSLVTRNSEKAIESYATLVEKFPSDDAGYNNLAVAYFLNLQFDEALQAGRKVLDLYPTKALYHANYALYAMYASHFDTATAAADKTLELNPDYHKAWLPHAAAALVEGDTEAARAAYEAMAQTGPRGASLANTGIADLLIWRGDAAAADAALIEGIGADEANGNTQGRKIKEMMRARALLDQGKPAREVSAQITRALELAPGMAQQVQAALMYVALDSGDEAQAIADQLGSRLEAQQRAYAKLIRALLRHSAGDNVAAVEELRAGLALADVWLIRFHLGNAYAGAGHYAEAVDEFTLCKERLGEAYSLFLDDTPTFRYTEELDSRLSQATESMTAQHGDRVATPASGDGSGARP
jgi:tetratricopeptide (TPR) repeat protein